MLLLRYMKDQKYLIIIAIVAALGGSGGGAGVSYGLATQGAQAEINQALEHQNNLLKVQNALLERQIQLLDDIKDGQMLGMEQNEANWQAVGIYIDRVMDALLRYADAPQPLGRPVIPSTRAEGNRH